MISRFAKLIGDGAKWLGKSCLQTYSALGVGYLGLIAMASLTSVYAATSWTVHNVPETTLDVRISATATTGIRFDWPTKNGTQIAWPTTSGGILQMVRQDGREEHVYYSRATNDSVNKTFTLTGTIVRDVCNTQGHEEDITGCGNGLIFSPGARARLVIDARNQNLSVKKDVVNSMSGSGSIECTATTQGCIAVGSFTTAQRNAFTYATGSTIIHNTSSGALEWYDGSSWLTLATDTGSFINASTTAAGKVQLASTGSMLAATAEGSTGAKNVVWAQYLTASGGSTKNGYVPVIDGSYLSGSLLGSGTRSATTFLRGDQTWATPVTIGDQLFGNGSDGAPTWTSGASLNPATEKNYTTATLPASQTLTVSTVNVPLVLHNTGDVTINGTVDLNGKGGAGGAGVTGTGDGTAGTAGGSLVPGWTNGAGAGGLDDTAETGGGGGSSLFADGGTGEGTGAGAGGTKLDAEKSAFLASIMRNIVCGAGGGGGSTTGAEDAGAGGEGGGCMVWFIGGDLTLGVDSVIRADGVDGVDGAGGNAGAGGGGAGGTVIIFVGGSITDAGVSLSALAGSGGISPPNDDGQDGGDGAPGKVIIYSISTGTLISS